MTDDSARYLPCRKCGAQAQVATLSQYGAQCVACFETYCTARQPAPSLPARREDWAKELRARHKSGERLTRFQVACYEAALGRQA